MKINLSPDASRAERDLLRMLRTARGGVMVGTRALTEKMKNSLRADVERSGLGGRLAKTWRSKFYENDGFNCAGFIYTKAPELIAAHSLGQTIRGKDGLWLAIPTENAPKKGEGGKRKISPSNWPEARYGRLRFVYRDIGPSFLVVDNVRASYSRKTGEFRGFRQASARAVNRGAVATVIMFILVKQVTMQKRLNPDNIARTLAATAPREILSAMRGVAE